MKFFSRQRKSDNWAISLDIGTEFVKTLIFHIEGERAVVKGAGKARQRLSDMAGGAVTDIEGVIRNADLAIAQAAKEADILPREVIMGIAGELVKGATTRIRYIRPNPKSKITVAELEDLIRRVQRRAFDQARAQLAWESGHEEIDVKLVNAAVTDVKIDSHPITNPIGFQGREVHIGVFNAFAPIVHFGALQTIAEELELNLMAIAAEPYAVAKAVSEGEGTGYSAIFMDIGGGTTDIALVVNGGVVGTKMFAFGGRSFTRRIATTLGLPFSQAEEIKLAYARGELSDERTKIVADAVRADCEVWFAGVELTLAEFQNIDLLPPRILLCGGGSSLPDLVDILKGGQWSKKLPFSKAPSVSHIEPKGVYSVVDETKTLTSVQDVTPMALANLAIGLAGEGNVVDTLVGRAMTTLRK